MAKKVVRRIDDGRVLYEIEGAEGVTEEQMDELEKEWKLSLADPNYAIVSNFAWDIREIPKKKGK